MELTENIFASVYNFITNFKPEEIDDVISDFKLKDNGYKVLYAIDTYDIVSHYLPYTEGGLFQHKNKNELAQKLICYDYFFSVKEAGNENGNSQKRAIERNRAIIILDEYKIELLSAKNKIMRQLKNVSNVINNLDYLKKETGQFSLNNTGANAYFEKNFEVILLLLILSEKKDFIHYDFEDFLKNRLSILEISSGSEKDDVLLNRIFRDSRHSELCIRLFDAFVEETKMDLISIDKEIDRYIYLENTFRDTQAIDRLLTINDKIAQAGGKYIVLYLSSAPFKTSELFKKLGSLDKAGQVELTNIKSLFINRNIYQCFLYEILSNEFVESDIDIGKALVSLRKLATKLENKEQKALNPAADWDVEDVDILKKLKGIFDIYSASLDNHFYIKIYEKYKDLYNAVSIDHKYGNKLKKDVDLMPIFTLIDNFINEDDFRQKYFDFTFTINQLKQAVEIADIISKANPVIPNIFFGKDIIKNSFHHLPYLLFLYEKEHNTLTFRLYDLLNNLVDISYPDHELLQELTIKLKKVVNCLVNEQNDMYLICLQQIIISYINLITATKKIVAEEEWDKEEEIIETLEKQLQIFMHLKVEAILNESGSNLEVKFKPNNFSKEIQYILLWLYRRNNRIEKGIKLGKHLISEYPADPRFYHGLALNYISKAYAFIGHSLNPPELTPTISDLKNALTYLRFAVEKYQNLMGSFHEENYGMLIVKNYMAVLNSLADISMRIYELEFGDDFSRIQEARDFLQKAKELFNMIKLAYNNYPVFSATELEIEYYEAKEFYEKGRYSEAHQKILNSQNRNLILEQNISKTPIDDRFLGVRKKIKDLSLLIFKVIDKR